ncbi:MAG: DUF4445 domain-containing protein [Chloroflexi bacterium]|nr:DUF4445 domain-containing protein [Chloroflexota bacterium]
MPVRFLPNDAQHEAQSGETILQVAERAGIPIERVCGGRGTCGKCRVVVVEGELSPLTSSERSSLSPEQLSAGYRLACQARVTSSEDVLLRIPAESQVEPVRILSSGTSDVAPQDPWVTRHHLQVPPAGLADQTADLDAVLAVWRSRYSDPLRLDLSALRQLPAALREEDGRITLIKARDRVIDVRAGHATTPLMGIAFDIGTTTVVGFLMDLETGEELAVASELNPQTKHGDNVIARIEYAESQAGLESLQAEIVGALNRIIDATTKAEGCAREDVLAATVVGNTTMQHLLLGISPVHLARSPYVPVYTTAQCVAAKDLKLGCHPEACIWLLPNIAGWVGADTVAVLLATGIYLDAEPALAIDIGTNGEMAMGSRERLIACSTAAGPAFEGAHISCGMRASSGAIEQVWVDDEVHWRAIADAPARGVCGSGLVDAISELLRVGVIDNQGRMGNPEALAARGLRHLAHRLQGENRHRVFHLTGSDDSENGSLVSLTQRDVRELQLAKGAVRAGIEIMMKELGLHAEDIRKVYLAGAFGNYIQPSSALGIGLLPSFPNAQLLPVGNAAGSGARQALLSYRACEIASELPSRVEYLELSGRPDFQEEFVEAMLF